MWLSCGCVCIPNNRLQVLCSYGKPPKEGKQRNDLPYMNDCHGGRCTQKVHKRMLVFSTTAATILTLVVKTIGKLIATLPNETL